MLTLLEMYRLKSRSGKVVVLSKVFNKVVSLKSIGSIRFDCDFLCDFWTCFLMFEKNVELFDWKRYIIAFDDIE